VPGKRINVFRSISPAVNSKSSRGKTDKANYAARPGISTAAVAKFMGHDHSRRANRRISSAVFSSLFAISKLDGLVDHPGDHDGPGASMARSAMGRRQGLASIILAILGLSLIVLPTWLLMNSFADSVHRLVAAVQQNTAQIPVPREGVQQCPIVGHKIYDTWSKAHADLPALVHSLQPKIGV